MDGTETRREAAFVRVEELLLPARDLDTALHLCLRAPGTGERAARLGLLSAGWAALWVLGRTDRRARRRLLGLLCRGLSRDRIEHLLAEHWERKLAGRLLEEGLRLVEREQAAGRRVVLVSTTLAAAIGPLVERLGADALLADEPEWRDGIATGRIVERGEQALAWAGAEGIDLRGARAWGTDLHDAPLLEAVGWPCAVNPDAGLRARADANGWPVLQLASQAAPAPVPANPAARIGRA